MTINETLDKLYELASQHDTGDNAGEMFDLVHTLQEALRQKSAHWIFSEDKKDPDFPIPQCRCSRCGYEGNLDGPTKFCPSCGSLMEEIPAVRKTKWIPVMPRHHKTDTFQCSSCGMCVMLGEEMVEPYYTYCPFCGKEMGK